MIAKKRFVCKCCTAGTLTAPTATG